MTQINLFMEQKQTDTCGKHTHGYQGGSKRGRDECSSKDWDQQIQTTTNKTDKHKVLLYSTGNRLHCFVINHNRKGYEKEYIYLMEMIYNYTICYILIL